jgi:hypothetical protein
MEPVTADVQQGIPDGCCRGGLLASTGGEHEASRAYGEAQYNFPAIDLLVHLVPPFLFPR